MPYNTQETSEIRVSRKIDRSYRDTLLTLWHKQPLLHPQYRPSWREMNGQLYLD